MKKKLYLYCFWLCFLSSFSSSQLLLAENMGLYSQSYSVGGRAFLNLKVDSGGDYSLGFVVEPEVSYFLADRFEMFLNFKINLDILRMQVDAFRERAITWGASLGPRYYFTNSTFAPYVGGGYGFEIDNLELDSLLTFASGSFGGLYSVNKSLGLDFSVPLRVLFSEWNHFEGIDIKPGFWGLKTNLK